MNSVSILANRVHWTRIVLKETTILVGYVSTIAGTTQKSTSGTQKNQTHKKTKFKLQTHSYTISFPLTLNLSLSLSVELSLTLALSFRACRFVAGTVADCSHRRRRRCRCLSLPSLSLEMDVLEQLHRHCCQSHLQAIECLYLSFVVVQILLCLWGTDAVGMEVRD